MTTGSEMVMQLLAESRERSRTLVEERTTDAKEGCGAKVANCGSRTVSNCGTCDTGDNDEA